MNRLFFERNVDILRAFRTGYGTMPTMTLYATIGEKYGLSEESIRKIVRSGCKKAKGDIIGNV